MAPAASAQSRGAARVSMNNYRLLLLLSLAYAPHLLAAKELPKKKEMNPASVGLKHAADNLIKKDQLSDYMYRITDAEMVTRRKILYPQLLRVLGESGLSTFDQIMKSVEKSRIYMDLMEESFTVEDVERELDDILKMSDFPEGV